MQMTPEEKKDRKADIILKLAWIVLLLNFGLLILNLCAIFS